MSFFKSVNNILFRGENICLFCKESMESSSNYICTSCMEFVEVVNREIKLDKPYIEKAYYSVLYNRLIRKKLHQFKFQGQSYLYKAFGEMLVNTIKAKGLQKEIDVITFVPIHRRKKALRGYNQSELLGVYVAKKLDIPLIKNHLIKAKWTLDQNKLGKVQRKTNLKDSFKVKNAEDLKGKEILLIDDIITTGATLGECGKVLMGKGAKRVYGLALTSSTKV